MIRRILLALSLLVSGIAQSGRCQYANGPLHQDACYAVVRVPSHGCSATVVWTGPGRTLLLGCGHAYKDRAKDKPMVIDCPAPALGAPQTAGLSLLAVDFRLDLSLVQLNAGPLPYVAPIAPLDSRHGRLVSCGYDNMVLRGGKPVMADAHLLAPGWEIAYTSERPWHGRSGGGLIDVDSGYLVGTCSGYEAFWGGKGIYTSLRAVHEFCRRVQPDLIALVPQAGPASPLGPAVSEFSFPAPAVDIQIAQEDRVPNRSGGQCVWSSIETCARYLRITRLYDLTQRYHGTADCGAPESVLRRRSVRFRSQPAGRRDPAILDEAIAQHLPVAVGVYGEHMVTLVAFGQESAKWIDNSDSRLGVKTLTRQRFLSAWDGWAIYLMPDGVDSPEQLPVPSQQQFRRMAQPGC